jgi:putative membrane protein
MRRLIPLLLVALPAFAHEGELHPQDAWNGATAVVLAVMLGVYARGAFRSRPRGWQIVSFAAGWLSVAIALLSPLDRISDILFSAHMAQHEILMLVSAPLLVLGSPLVVMLWAFGAGARQRIGQFVRTPVVTTVWERVTGPLFVLIAHAAVLWAWHVPALFEAALHNETIHVFQHLGFFITAALFWWALIHGRYGRIGYGVGVAYVFATAMHTQILGALLTFGNRTWYPTHAARTGAAALDDQQLAGAVMWIPFGVVFVVVALALFAAWLGEAERRVAFTTAGRLTREEAPHA